MSLTSTLGICPDWVPAIDKKLDPKQVTFIIPSSLIPTAIAVFYKRYVIDIGNRPGFYVNWLDQTKDNEQLNVNISTDLNNISQNEIPTTLFKSKIQVNYGLHKLVTITLFHTTGTVLIQGHKCKRWIACEFPCVTEVTRQVYWNLVSDPSLDIERKYKTVLSQLPVPAVTTLQSSDVTIEDIPDTETNKSSEVDNSPLPISTSTESSSLFNTDVDETGVRDEPCASINSVNNTEKLSDCDSFTTISTGSDKSGDNNDVSVPFTMNDNTINIDSNGNKDELPVVIANNIDSNGNSDNDHSLSAITSENDAGSPKNENNNDNTPDDRNDLSPPSASVSDKQQDIGKAFASPANITFNTSTENISDIRTIENATKNATITITDNEAKVSRRQNSRVRVGGWKSVLRPLTLSRIQQKLKKTRKQMAQLTDLCISSVAIVKSIIETNNTQIKSEIKTHVKHKYDTHSEQITSLSSKIKALADQNNALKSQLTQLKQQLLEDKKKPATKMDRNTTPVTHSQEAIASDSNITDHETSTDSNITDHETSPVQKSTDDNFTHTAHPPGSSSSQTTASYSASSPPTNTIPDNQETAKGMQQSPGQHLAQCRVDHDTNHLLIGDSILCPVRSDLLFPQGVSQKLAFPGLTMDDVVHWLKHIPRSPHVQTVTVHIGINTCWRNAITESQWRQLIRLLKSIFPTAKLCMSAIVPPFGQHTLSKTATVSNTALAIVCKTEGAIFANHTDIFCTSTGAPRKALYRDALHPANQGTVRLAHNIKKSFGLTDSHKIQPKSFPTRILRPNLGHNLNNYHRHPLLPTPIQHHSTQVQHQPGPVQNPASIVQHNPTLFYNYPSPVPRQFTAFQESSKHDHFPPNSLYQHPNAALYLPNPNPFKSSQSSSQSRQHYMSLAASYYQPRLYYRQPPSYSDVVKKTRGCPSSSMCLETEV